MKPHRNSSNTLCTIAVVIITSICMLIFTIDLLYEHNISVNSHPSKHPSQTKGKHLHYDGVELNVIEDWGRRDELASKLNIDKHLKPLSG